MVQLRWKLCTIAKYKHTFLSHQLHSLIIYLTEMKTYVHNDTIYKSQVLETTQMPINNRMDKIWYIHAIDEHFTTTCNNMDLKHNAENQT